MVTKILRCTFVLGFIFTQIACSSSKVAQSDDYSPETMENDGFADTDEVPMGFGDDQLPADLTADGGVTGTGEFPTDTAGTTEAPQSDMGDQPSYDIAGSTDTAMESQPTDAYGAYDEPAPITESSYAESTPSYEAAPITDSTDYGTSEPSYSGASGSYRVKSGDTLMKIAFEQYGDLYRWKEILESNQGKIQDPNRLPAGLELSLADAGGVVIERNGEKYLIKTGDTLGLISKDVYGTPSYWRDLWNNNKQLIKDPNRIYAGFFLYYQPLNRLTGTMDTRDPASSAPVETAFQQEPAAEAPFVDAPAAPADVAPAPEAPVEDMAFPADDGFGAAE